MKLQSIFFILLSSIAMIGAIVMAFIEEYRIIAMISIVISFTSLELYIETKNSKQ